MLCQKELKKEHDSPFLHHKNLQVLTHSSSTLFSVLGSRTLGCCLLLRFSLPGKRVFTPSYFLGDDWLEILLLGLLQSVGDSTRSGMGCSTQDFNRSRSFVSIFSLLLEIFRMPLGANVSASRLPQLHSEHDAVPMVSWQFLGEFASILSRLVSSRANKSLKLTEEPKGVAMLEIFGMVCSG